MRMRRYRFEGSINGRTGCISRAPARPPSDESQPTKIVSNSHRVQSFGVPCRAGDKLPGPFYLPIPPSTPRKPIKAPLVLNQVLLPSELPSLQPSVGCTPSTPVAIVSEKRRSSGIDESSGSDINEKDLHQDIVSTTTPTSLPLSYIPRSMRWQRRFRPLGRISWRIWTVPRR